MGSQGLFQRLGSQGVLKRMVPQDLRCQDHLLPISLGKDHQRQEGPLPRRMVTHPKLQKCSETPKSDPVIFNFV
jgi:hypothetical protein